jgi:hypothetical protein
MQMFYTIPKPKPIPQIQPTFQKTVDVVPNPFTNIFSRLQTSGKCGSCGK